MHACLSLCLGGGGSEALADQAGYTCIEHFRDSPVDCVPPARSQGPECCMRPSPFLTHWLWTLLVLVSREEAERHLLAAGAPMEAVDMYMRAGEKTAYTPRTHACVCMYAVLSLVCLAENYPAQQVIVLSLGLSWRRAGRRPARC